MGLSSQIQKKTSRLAAFAGVFVFAFQVASASAAETEFPAPTAEETAALKSVLAESTKAPNGKALAAYGSARGVRILPLTGELKASHMGWYDNKSHTMRLNTDTRSLVEVLATFSHENEHIRQDFELHSQKMERRTSPKQLYEILQFSEAGACAASADYISGYVIATGAVIPPEVAQGENDPVSPQIRIAATLIPLKQSSADGELSAQQYYESAFLPCAAALDKWGYGLSHIFEYIVRSDEGKTAEKTGKPLWEPLSDAAMSAYLGSFIRKDFATLNIDPTPAAYFNSAQQFVDNLVEIDKTYRTVLQKNRVYPKLSK